jgi:N-acetylmuramoyl-L-alanine amidase
MHANEGGPSDDRGVDVWYQRSARRQARHSKTAVNQVQDMEHKSEYFSNHPISNM